jgi:transposase
MRLTSLLNHVQHYAGFVYGGVRLLAERQTLEIDIRPRRGSKPVCSHCHQRAPAAYDHLGVRHFEFIPFWGFQVELIYLFLLKNVFGAGIGRRTIVAETCSWIGQ